MTKENDNLDFDQAKDLTIGEAVRKDAELKAGVTAEDSVLDKYIKQHPDKVAARKFETKDGQLETLDTATLDDFIKKQREAVGHQLEGYPAASLPEVMGATEPGVQEVLNEPTSDSSSVEGVLREEISPVLNDFSGLDDKPFYQKKPAILGGLLLLVLAISGIGYAIHQWQSQKTLSGTSQSSQKTLDASEKGASAQAIKDNETFEENYRTFFADKASTKLKNEAFGKLPELETLLKKLEKTKFYDAAKEKYDSLKEQMDGIQAVNAKFDGDIIVNGELIESIKPKADSNFDDLSVEILNTGNATLDNLLQKAVKKGRDELKGQGDSGSSDAKSGEGSSKTAPAPKEEKPQAPADDQQASAPAASPYGLSHYDSSRLQRHLSRVPYHQDALADSGNPAWQFNPGILETIVATAQARGHISGNHYILERVNIVNGNGYYNMFTPEGTYLFSINAKTGYFVGNKPGNADALDY